MMMVSTLYSSATRHSSSTAFLYPPFVCLRMVVRSNVRARPSSALRVQKTQITFSARFGFAWFWLPDRRVKGCPEAKLMVSFGLDHRVESSRIFAAVEPYPNRWTHHVPVATPAEQDGELLDWLEQAYAFGQRPGRKQR